MYCRNRLIRQAVAALAAVLMCLLPGSAHGYQYVESYLEDIAVVHQTFRLQLWHYSGGYWKGTDLAGKDLQISDRLIDEAGLSGRLTSSQYVNWTGALPSPVRQEILSGSTVEARVEGQNELYNGTLCRISGSTFTVYARPVFHVASNATLSSFVSGIKVTIPLVSTPYGRNLYSLYSLRSRGVIGTGLFRESDPYYIMSPYLHPSQIANRFGTLRPGYTVLAGDAQVSSEGWSVGLMTLMRGGAVGLEFDFPMDIVFSAERLRTLWAQESSGIIADVPEGSYPSEPFPAADPYEYPAYDPPAPQEFWQEDSDPPAPPFDPWLLRIHRLY